MPASCVATAVFRNAKAVDDYHNMVGGMFKNPLFMCEMMTLAPCCCRQSEVGAATYGEADEISKITTTMDGGRCKKAVKTGKLKKVEDPSVAGLIQQFGPLHYGWIEGPSLNEVDRS